LAINVDIFETVCKLCIEFEITVVCATVIKIDSQTVTTK